MVNMQKNSSQDIGEDLRLHTKNKNIHFYWKIFLYEFEWIN